MPLNIRTKRPQLILIGAFAVGYLALFILTTYAHSLKILLFAYLTIAIGFAPAYYFRKTFSFASTVAWLFHAGALGVLFTPLVFIFFGWLKFNFIFVHSTAFLIFLAAASLLTLWFADPDEFRMHLAIGEFTRLDLLIGAVFLAFSALLTLINFNRIEIHWDAFTFWGLDGKYIFEHNQLRGQAFHTDVIMFRYTAFHPLYHTLIYDLYGTVVEQFAAWVNVYFNFLAMGLIYVHIPRRNAAEKSWLAASILIISYTAISVVYVFSLNADVLVALLLLIYFLILTGNRPDHIQTYWQRAFLLSLLAMAFFFIKSPFLIFSLILTALWPLYDLPFLRTHWKSLLNSRALLVSLLSVAGLWTMRAVYFANIGGDTFLEKSVSNYSVRIQAATWETFSAYALTLADYMLERSPYLLAIWCLALISIFFVKARSKPFWYRYLFTLAFFMIPVAQYLLRQASLQSESLPRYTAMVMYLFPLIFGYVQISETRVSKLASYAGFSLIVGFVFFKLMWPMPVSVPFSFSSGTYQTELAKYQRYSEEVIQLAGPDARILIADDLAPNTITSRNIPAIFLRYYMLDNSVGAQYTIPIDSLSAYAGQTRATYLLLLSYQDTFDGCSPYLTAGRDYLIHLESGSFTTGSGECLISQFTIQDLGKAVQ